jgi:hypothetical protein
MPTFHQVPESHDTDVLELRERFGARLSDVLDVLREPRASDGKLSLELLKEVSRAWQPFGNVHFPESRNVTIDALDPTAKIPEYKVCAVQIAVN